MDERERVGALIETIWRDLGHEAKDDAPSLPATLVMGTPGGLPSVFHVGTLASAAIGAASAALSDFVRARTGGEAPLVTVDQEHAAAAFRSERLLMPVGWKLPPVWDPIAGDYRGSDGFVRIHTNYAHHREAALRALGAAENREAVASACAKLDTESIETAIVDAGGAAAKMRSLQDWAGHEQGLAVAAEPLVANELGSPLTSSARAIGPASRSDAPLAGVRVLDLTRVIAGPVCTRVLAAYGAEVLRIDPPGFEEVGALLGETTAGKHRAALDLKTDRDRALFLERIAGADLLVCGYRGDALERLGCNVAALRAVNPALSIVLVDAYGWSGPWRNRRGFDSLVQMSAGIADRGRRTTGTEAPVSLPAQALDHGAGYLMAAAALRALTRRFEHDVATTARLSLARVAKMLVDLGDDGDPKAPELGDVDAWREAEDSAFGPLRRVRVPVRIAGATSHWARPAGPLGVDAPEWH